MILASDNFKDMRYANNVVQYTNPEIRVVNPSVELGTTYELEMRDSDGKLYWKTAPQESFEFRSGRSDDIYPYFNPRYGFEIYTITVTAMLKDEIIGTGKIRFIYNGHL